MEDLHLLFRSSDENGPSSPDVSSDDPIPNLVCNIVTNRGHFHYDLKLYVSYMWACVGF